MAFRRFLFWNMILDSDCNKNVFFYCTKQLRTLFRIAAFSIMIYDLLPIKETRIKLMSAYNKKTYEFWLEEGTGILYEFQN